MLWHGKRYSAEGKEELVLMRFLCEWQPERLRGSWKSTVERMRVRMVQGDSSSLASVTSLNIDNSASMKYTGPENQG